MSGKTKEEIAFELVSKLKGVGVWGENNMASILDMYAECLEATSGLRSVNGQKPLALVLKDAAANSAPASSAVVPAQAQRPAAPAPRPPAPGQVPVQPVVRQQQQHLQQTLQQQIPQAR